MSTLKKITEEFVVKYAGKKKVALSDIKQRVLEVARKRKVVLGINPNWTFYGAINPAFWKAHKVKVVKIGLQKYLTFPPSAVNNPKSKKETFDNSSSEDESSEERSKIDVVTKAKKRKLGEEQEEERARKKSKLSSPIHKLVTLGDNGMKVTYILGIGETTKIGPASFIYNDVHKLFQIRCEYLEENETACLNSFVIPDQSFPIPIYNSDVLLIKNKLYRVEVTGGPVVEV
jgi:hypothetical protein